MNAAVWLSALAVGVVGYFLYRGWHYEESLASDGAYALAREASRDESAAEVVEDWAHRDAPADEVRCHHCGTENESDFAFCERCATRLPDRRDSRHGVARPGD
jgi:uncharacterized paraquat-inducible protein A